MAAVDNMPVSESMEETAEVESTVPNITNINIQDRIHIKTVFQDCIDQLAILGTILPISLEHSTKADYVEKVL